MNIWFSADLHLGHGRIIQYCNRPFATHEEMNEGLLQNFNSVIRKGDVLYLLGDVCWSNFDFNPWFNRLNCRQVFLILGNHDNKKPTEYKRFVWTGDLKSIHIGDHGAMLCHYPMRSWKGKSKGRFHLFGHCHGTLPGWDRSMDVGVDPNNYMPVNWDDIVTKLKDIPPFGSEPQDSHNLED